MQWAAGEMRVERRPAGQGPWRPRDSRSRSRRSPGTQGLWSLRSCILQVPLERGPTFARARWSSTRWFVSESPRTLQASSADKPSTSRSVITARWFSGSAAIASSTVRRASPASRRSSGTPRGGALHSPPRLKRSTSTAVPSSSPSPDEGGEGQRPRLAHAARLRLVRQDPEEPGLQGGAALESLEARVDREPRVGDDLLGDRPRRHVHHRHPQE